MMKTLFQWSVWPLCLAANTRAGRRRAMFAPQVLPQVAAATTVLLIFVLLADRAVSSLSHRLVRPRRRRDLARRPGHTVVYAALAVNALALVLSSWF
jgi:hypothetical protein